MEDRAFPSESKVPLLSAMLVSFRPTIDEIADKLSPEPSTSLIICIDIDDMMTYTTGSTYGGGVVQKSSQFFFRISPTDRKIIDKAAKIDRRTMSDFIRLAAIDRAVEVIEAAKKLK